MNQTYKTTKSIAPESYDPDTSVVPGFSYRLCRLLATCDVHGKGFLKKTSEITDSNQSALRRWVFEDHVPVTISQIVNLVLRIARHSRVLNEEHTISYVSWVLFGDDVAQDPTKAFWKALVNHTAKMTQASIDMRSPSPLDDWDSEGVKALTSSFLDQRLAKGADLKSAKDIDIEIGMFILRLQYGGKQDQSKNAS